MSLDLLNEPIPTEWALARRCPSCGGVELKVWSDPVEMNGWCTTECAGCGRELRRDFFAANVDGLQTWEDPEWVKATEQ